MDALTRAYLRRLGVSDPGPPSAQALRRLHAAHVERVPYETVGIALGRPVGITPEDSAARIVAGWGGYCYHLNGAFAWLLDRLGYAVQRHLAGVQAPGRPAPGPNGNHLALTVSVDGQTWLVDVGLGLGLHEPMPLRPGRHTQGPFTLELQRSTLTDGWRLEQDPRIDVFQGVDIADATASMADFQAKHARLSTDPQSGFVAWVSVQLRTADAAWAMKNLVLTRYDGATAERDLDSPDALWHTLAERFHFAPPDLTGAEREALWGRLWAAHRRWRG
ncbi:MAG: arylamine N-acetyltransferase family protein [Dermatophilaceae bacterium]